ncbi:hypothetical protein [Paraburkholderia sp. RL17-337-BIB-A]|uniref:hypothetical protein n=1 Tax=Paraburkholderia sp. RL17-337-BIB-A TaxID=3031636 RepID=UPI0038BBA166
MFASDTYLLNLLTVSMSERYGPSHRTVRVKDGPLERLTIRMGRLWANARHRRIDRGFLQPIIACMSERCERLPLTVTLDEDLLELLTVRMGERWHWTRSPLDPMGTSWNSSPIV